MPEVFFGKAKTKRYHERLGSDRSDHSDSSVAVHLRTQHYQARGLGKLPRPVTTRVVKLNHGSEVSSDAFQSLCPDHEKWKQLPIDGPIDSAFSEKLLHYLTDIRNSRKTKLFLGGKKGFVPQYGFTASLVEHTSLQRAVKQIEGVSFKKDGTAYRLVFNEVAFFWGPKGKTKEEVRDSNQAFTIDDIDTTQFAKEMNLELKFQVATVTGKQTACSTRGCFFNAVEPYPASSFQDNNHITVSNQSLMGDGSVDTIMEKTRDNLGKIIEFIKRNPNDFVPPKPSYQLSSQWIHRNLFDSHYGPTKPEFKSRSIEDLTQQHTDLAPISRTINLDAVGTDAPKLADSNPSSTLSVAQKKKKKKKENKEKRRAKNMELRGMAP